MTPNRIPKLEVEARRSNRPEGEDVPLYETNVTTWVEQEGMNMAYGITESLKTNSIARRAVFDDICVANLDGHNSGWIQSNKFPSFMALSYFVQPNGGIRSECLGIKIKV